MGELDNKKDALEAFVHMFIAEPELERRFMSMVDDYARHYHIRESKRIVQRMNDIELFNEDYIVGIESNELKIAKKKD